MKTLINILIIMVIGASFGVLIINHQQEQELLIKINTIAEENTKDVVDETIKSIIGYTYDNSVAYYFQKIDKNSKVKLVNSNEYEVILNNKPKLYQLFEQNYRGKYLLFHSKKVFLENIKKEYEKENIPTLEETASFEAFESFLGPIKFNFKRKGDA